MVSLKLIRNKNQTLLTGSEGQGWIFKGLYWHHVPVPALN